MGGVLGKKPQTGSTGRGLITKQEDTNWKHQAVTKQLQVIFEGTRVGTIEALEDFKKKAVVFSFCNTSGCHGGSSEQINTDSASAG